MNPNTHVYCTNCKHFRLVSYDGGYVAKCINEDECNIWDCEDSKPYSERPMYEAFTDFYSYTNTMK